MKKNILHLILLLFLSVNVTAAILPGSDYKKIFNEAEAYFVNENYTAALPLYMQLDSMEKGNANLNFKIGFCYLNAATYKTKSIPYFEEAIKNIAKKYGEGEMNEKKAPLASYYYLAKAYHLNYEFDKAIEMYEKYKVELGTGTDPKLLAEIDDVNHDIETCNNGKELIKNPKKVIVNNLGDAINTKYPEYSPVVSLDEQTLIFTSRREGATSNAKEDNGQYFEDIYISHYENDKWQKATPIGTNINTAGHEATVNLSADGQKLLIYKDDNGNGNIYVSELKGDEWGVPQYIGAPINTSSWESHACFSADNRILYFVSDRPGGYGGRDIYKCLKLPNGEWGPAQNLGDKINTKYDEDGVFIHPDGKQIFFSSKGHNSMGGFDIFTSIIDDENGFWSTPVNYGYPVNTTDDDVFLITTADGRRAFFSSDKEGGFGEKDIYMIMFPENEPRDVTILLGRIINNSTEDITANKIYIINTTKGDTTQVLTANSASGKYGANLPVGSSYKTVYTVKGKEIFSEILESPKGHGYQVIKREVPYNGSNAVYATDNSHSNKDSLAMLSKQCDPQKSVFQLFFKYNKKEIDARSDEFKNFIDALFNCLAANPSYSIEIESSASTVPTRTFRTNENLANRRAEVAQEQVLKGLQKKGIKQSQINFAAPKAMVQGPEYKKDAKTNESAYEQYQYIKIKAGAKK
jgi:Tol biopolymer transport system component/outer membrane protein OmpA-like peptidoglycan-associated protein